MSPGRQNSGIDAAHAALLREAVNLFAWEFENDEDVPGADLVEAFSEWRTRAKAALADAVSTELA